MENSFYYFFSTTPQVLGGLIALFGVFVIFKIDLLKNQILGVSKTIYDKTKEINFTTINNELRVTPQVQIVEGDLLYYSMNKLNELNEKQDIDELKSYINKIHNSDYSNLKDKYNKLYEFRKELMKRTIDSTIFTSIIIISSLFLLTLGKFIDNQPCIIIPLFLLFIGAIIKSFRLFFSILKDSLS